jgi:hypothetical protein
VVDSEIFLDPEFGECDFPHYCEWEVNNLYDFQETLFVLVICSTLDALALLDPFFLRFFEITEPLGYIRLDHPIMAEPFFITILVFLFVGLFIFLPMNFPNLSSKKYLWAGMSPAEF